MIAIKKKITRQTCLVFLVSVSFSCQKENKTLVTFDETMEIHDIAMAKMEDLYVLKRSLKKLKDSLVVGEVVDSARMEKISQVIIDLDASDEAMMSWMHQFETQYKDDDTEENLKYYLGQKEMVMEVNTKMDNSITNAGAILKR